MKELDFEAHGLGCRRQKKGKLWRNVELRLLHYSEFERANREWLWLDLALNILDRFCPDDGQRTLKLKRDVVWLYIDFARVFLLNPR